MPNTTSQKKIALMKEFYEINQEKKALADREKIIKARIIKEVLGEDKLKEAKEIAKESHGKEIVAVTGEGFKAEVQYKTEKKLGKTEIVKILGAEWFEENAVEKVTESFKVESIG